MYTPKQINDLKSDPAILQVVQARVPSLEQIGAEFKGLCPFHEEDTPSFTVRQDDGIFLFKCFGCGKNGNLLQFVQFADNVSFNQAVEKVADLIGWKKGKDRVDQTFTALKEEKEVITFPLAKIAEAETALTNSKPGQDWLASRGILLETARLFHLGYVQSARAVNPHHEKVNDGWIIFPTHDGTTITALKYRSVAGKDFLYKTGMKVSLFNLQDVDVFDDVFVVEGEPDCLAMRQAGFPCVAYPSAGYTPTPDERDALTKANRIFLAGDMDNPGQQAMTKLWTELRERTFKIEWPAGMKDANQTFLENCAGDVLQFKAKTEELKKKALEQPIPFVYDLRQTLRTTVYTKPMDDPARLFMPWASVDSWGAILPSDVVAVSATETGTGKALRADTKIPVPSGGFVAIKDLRVGDKVFGQDGKPKTVFGVFPQGVRKSYKLTFSDKTTIECDENHLWAVGTGTDIWRRKFGLTKSPVRVASLSEIMKKPIFSGTRIRNYIPMCEPIQFEKKNLPMHPYVMGALLGDGGFTNTALVLTSADPELVNLVSKLLPQDVELTATTHPITFRIVRKLDGRGKHNSVINTLKRLQLHGCRSESKSIPPCYKFSSVEDRLELLRGLCDTDGGMSGNSVEYSSSSRQLAEDVLFLVQSLGGRAVIKPKKTERLMSYRLHIALPLGMNPFHLSRKANQYHREIPPQRGIIQIEEMPPQEMVCISVDSADGLFVAENFIVTHNTSWLMNILLENAKRGKVVVNYSAEVSPRNYAVRAAAYLLQKKKDDITEQDLQTAADLMGEAQFYNGYKPGANWKEVIELLAWAKRRLGADILVLDHLHFLTRSERDETRAQSEAMRMLKDLAVQYNIIMIVLGQPRKPLANHRGREMVTQDLKGSETFGSDASQVFILHRDRKSNGDDSNLPIFDPVCKVKLDKSRESEPRATKLFFDGARCTFGLLERNYDEYAE